MCITSLAPVCPLIAPAALLYYAVCQPMLRWLLVFVFKPKYDGGGDKWPQLHQIIISSMILGQVSVITSHVLDEGYRAKSLRRKPTNFIP
jgi:hypothetical protein